MKKILLLGEKSFAATGLYELLKNNYYQVDCFSRGVESKNGDFIKGDVFALSNNIYLAPDYDIVINFILIKNDLIGLNLDYIKEVDNLCRVKKVKNLLHISSISSYPGNLEFIDEESEIEKNHTIKGNYAGIKVAVDNYLLSIERPYALSFIRPGFIYTSGLNENISGIGLKILPGLAIILGNKKTPLTVIRRERLHEGILRVIETGCDQRVYLMFENNDSKKSDFLRNNGYKIVIPLNKRLIINASLIFKKTGVFKQSHFEQIESLFKQTSFCCYQTEFILNYSFIPNSICIIGAGTYGSYIVNRIRESNKDVYITIFDVGNEKVRSENEIGYKTNILKDAYHGTSKGRYFGFGGTSNKWGGQLLTFSKIDFSKTSGFLRDIVSVNQKYRDLVFAKFNIRKKFEDKPLGGGLFIKTGYWLGYFRRNLFKYLHVNKSKNLKIVSDARVLRLLQADKNVFGFEFIKGGRKHLARFERYFLSTGAFESFRIILNSNVYSKETISFSDHISRKIFHVSGSTKIGEEDFGFRLHGTSLITKRIIGEIDGVSFFVYPNFNDNFPFFQNLKALLFRKEFNLKIIKSLVYDLPGFLAFCWSVFIKKRIYVYKNEWEIKIDIENPSKESKISLSESVDKFGERALDLEFHLSEKSMQLYEKIHRIVKNHLDYCNVKYIDLFDDFQGSKVDDTYHPYGMLHDVDSMEEYFNWFNNLLVVNTGILPRAGGINTAAAIFPVIEEYFSRYPISDNTGNL